MPSKILPFALSALAATPVLAAETPVWVVRDDDSTVYMVGTVHMMQGTDEDALGVYSDLVAEADEVWLEIAGLSTPPSNMLALLNEYAMSPDRPLSEVLSDEEMDALTALLDEHGIPLEAFENARPWFVYLQLTGIVLAEAGFDPADGLDVHIEEMAEDAEVPVYGFESFESQFSVFAEMDEETQVQILREVLFEAESATQELIASLEAWTTGDLGPLEEVVDDMYRGAPEFYETLIVRRNESFADGVEDILNGEGTALVAVGLAHFAGPHSIPAILEERGYTVESR